MTDKPIDITKLPPRGKQVVSLTLRQEVLNHLKRGAWYIRLTHILLAVLAIGLLLGMSAEPTRGSQGRLALLFDWMPDVIRLWLFWSFFFFSKQARTKEFDSSSWLFAVIPITILLLSPLTRSIIVSVFPCETNCTPSPITTLLALSSFALAFLIMPFAFELWASLRILTLKALNQQTEDSDAHADSSNSQAA